MATPVPTDGPQPSVASPMRGNDERYDDLVPRFRDVVRRAVPRDSIVAVVSKGDPQLLNLDGRRGWHFPQRPDGVYAGYYPPDSATAISHLEALRARGAAFLAFPAPAGWWLDKYPGFRQHLEGRYQLLVRDDTCLFYALVERAGARGDIRGTEEDAEGSQQELSEKTGELVGTATRAVPAGVTPSTEALSSDRKSLEDVRSLFDQSHYEGQTGISFESYDDALSDYLKRGFRKGYNPHPLFDTAYYLDTYSEVRNSGENPLIHFVTHSVDEQQDPNPYFDTAYYYSIGTGLRNKNINALVHYITHQVSNDANPPNPLFRDRWYLFNYSDVRDSGLTPLAHYLTIGCREGRFVSHIHQNIMDDLRRSSAGSLRRGSWKNGTVLWFAVGESHEREANLVHVADALASEHHLECIVVLARRKDSSEATRGASRVVVLEDYELACEIFRPSALRLLAKALSSLKPAFAVSELPEVVTVLPALGVPTYFLLADRAGSEYGRGLLDQIFRSSQRVLLPSAETFEAVAQTIGRYPPNVARRPARASALPQSDDGDPEPNHRSPSVDRYARFLFQLAVRDLRLSPTLYSDRTNPAARPPTKTVLIPCSDWSVSGVNASLEAIGEELIRFGWDVQIIFTRSASFVLESAGAEENMPKIPYRYLEPNKPGVEGMWESLISEFENRAPCILFMAYDFLGNAVAPALTNAVGAVTWVQADDGDYYEQVYRLGRYCHAVVCVSQHIQDTVAALNPAIGERAHVIYNSSVHSSDVIEKRAPRSDRIRIVYAGRLVQYQKRILDFIDLARALDRLGVPYEVSLIGTFSGQANTGTIFTERAKAHLDDGRIRLLGRLPRDRILHELTYSDFFVLLSDFEGLPLALVEGMARGCVPIVPETQSGIPEIVSDNENGLTIPGRDYDEWARAVAELWHDRPRVGRLSRKARDTVRQRFTVEVVGRQFHDLFTRVAAEVAAGAYDRPAALNWGERSPVGDVLPPPSAYRPFRVPGLH